MHKFGSSLRDWSAVNPKPTMLHHNSSLFWQCAHHFQLCEDEKHDGRKGTVMTYFMLMHLLHVSGYDADLVRQMVWHGGLGLTALLSLNELPNLCILNLTASLTFQTCMRYYLF